MKKILFGIALLGLNSILLANSSVEVKKTLKVSTCYTQTVTQFENSKGEYLRSETGPRVAVDCAPGQLAGST